MIKKRMLGLCAAAMIIFSFGAGAQGNVISESFTDEMESLDSVYSIDDCSGTWAPVQKQAIGTQEASAYVIEPVGEPDGWKQWSIDKNFALWWKATDGKGFTTVKFTVWYNNDKYNAGYTPRIVVKDADGNISDAAAEWTRVSGTWSSASGWNCKVIGQAMILTGSEYVGLGFSGSGITASSFYLDKVELIVGEEADTTAVNDSLSDYSHMWTVSNFIDYSKISAEGAATFTDTSLLGMETLNKEGYVIYKAGEGRVFTGIDMIAYTRDGGTNPVIQVSVDGSEFTDSEISFTYTQSKGGSGSNDGGYSDKNSASGAFDIESGYKYVKIYHAGVSKSQQVKLGEINLTTSLLPEYRVIEPGFIEDYAGFENVCENKNFTANNEYQIFYVSGSAVEAGETEAYVTYRLKAGASFSIMKVTFRQQSHSNRAGEVIALDKNKEPIAWDQEGEWSMLREENGAYCHTFEGAIPDGTAYIMLRTTYMDTNWKSRIKDIEFRRGVEVKMYDESSSEPIEKLPESGCSLLGTVQIYNMSADRNVLVFSVLRQDGNRIKAVDLNKESLTEVGEYTLIAPTLENCEIDENTTFEIIVLDADTLAPILPQKAVFYR